MKNYHLKILGISEIRWTEAGQTNLSTGEIIIYSGIKGQNAYHTKLVEIMMTSRANKSLIVLEPDNERIILARFRTTPDTLTNCHNMLFTNERSRQGGRGEFFEVL